MKSLRRHRAKRLAHGATLITLVLSAISLTSTVSCLAAEAVKLKFIQSLYFDEKGGGFKQPQGVACNDKSLLLVADPGNGRLVQYAFKDKVLREGKEIKLSQLLYPIEVQVDSKGKIFSLDGKQRRIIYMSPAGEYQGQLAIEGIQSPATFIPRSFKIDSKDNIYVLDVFGARVLILSPDGKYQKQIEFPKDYGFLSDIAVDPKGTILLIDSTKARVYSAPRDSGSFSPLTGSLREYLNFPTSITTDARGTIYVVDESGGGIVILGQDGSFMGRQLTMGWNEGLLYYPSQMCINDKGEVFIADRGNNRVQIFNLVK